MNPNSRQAFLGTSQAFLGTSQAFLGTSQAFLGTGDSPWGFTGVIDSCDEQARTFSESPISTPDHSLARLDAASRPTAENNLLPLHHSMIALPLATRIPLVLLATLALATPTNAESSVEDLLDKPDAWFQSDAGRQTLENLLSWQTSHGDWPKNIDTAKRPPSGGGGKRAGTFDNGATVGELRVLARAFRITGDTSYQQAFLRGFDHIIKAQYANGGWPQYYPLSKAYHRHITFNDGTMIRLMEFLRDATGDPDFAFLDADRRSAAGEAVDRGIDCIVNCQVLVDGVPTVWCAQHDAESLTPVQARSYELPSLSGSESAGILKFLMSIDEPSPAVVRAVNAGVAWFDTVKIEGYRYRRSKTEAALSPDPKAAPLWARFYEIPSNRPIFSDRDGVVKYDLQEIGSERRGGYTWYGNWGENVLKQHAKWPHASRKG